MSLTPQYQSRLFQTVRSQVHHLKDNVQLRWRQLKVAAIWGAQMGLYPLYTLFQAGRWSGQVLKQSAAHGKQALLALMQGNDSPGCDQPIQQVLDAIELWSLPATETVEIVLRPISRPPSRLARWGQSLRTVWQRWGQWNQQKPLVPFGLKPSTALECQNDLAQRGVIQGIASSLIDRRLILITATNQPLDVLTADQQRQLHQRIIWEIAQALYLRRQYRGTRPLPDWKTWLAKPLQVRPQYSHPVRALYGLMAWVQQPPIVQPMALPPRAGFLRLGRSPLALPNPPALLSKLRNVKQSLLHRLSFLNTLGWGALIPLGSPQPRATPAQEDSGLLSRWLNPVQQKLQTYRTILLAMAGAIALVPFTLALPEPAKAAAVPALPSPFPTPILVERLIDPSRSRRRWQAETALSKSGGQSSQGRVRIAPQRSTTGLTAQGFEGAIAHWASRFSQATMPKDNSTIEVDAVFMGYDYHPLELLLLWLDRAIAWIEGQLIKIGHWLLPKLQAWHQHHWPN